MASQNGFENSNRLDHAVTQYVRQTGLSGREAQVFSLLTKGSTSSGEIAEALGVSRNTVRNHFQNIFYKTRTNSKTDLLAQFICGVFGDAADSIRGTELA